MRPDPAKVEKIKSIPAPTNVSQVRSLLGSLNYYSRFVPQMKSLRAPLDNLLKKDTKFVWSKECQDSFQHFKEFLSSDLLLTHYNPKLPIIVAADASKDGIGSVLMHQFPDGNIKVVQHASRSLTPAEKNYSQIEKEALGLIFAVTKFHRYIYGREFSLQTDHRPLVSIFGSKKGIPVYTANRLQRWALTLLNYNFKIKYINTKEFGYADMLSRLIDQQQKPEEDFIVASVQLEEEIDCILQECHNNLPVSFKVIKNLTKRDSDLQKVIEYVQTQWPDLKQIPKNLQQFYTRRDTLSVVQSCLMSGERIVIPSKLQKRIIRQLHRGHPGIVNMKAIARGYVYWPHIDRQLEDCVKSCSSCQSAAKAPTKTLLQSWNLTTEPFERIHIDYAGPIQGKYYLCIVDSYSKWPEIYSTNSTSTSATIDCLQDCFARFGNPVELVSDNATGFTSAVFKTFCEENGIVHKTIAAFHPQSNGQAEKFVDTFKRALKKMEGEGKVGEIVSKFLQIYRITPNRSSQHGKSPSEAMFGRKIRTNLSLLLPPKETHHLKNVEQEKQFNQKHGAVQRDFHVKDSVNVIRHQNNKSHWEAGIVIEKIGNVMYNVLLNKSNKLVRVHTNQMRKIPNPQTTEKSKDLPLYILLEDFKIKDTSENSNNQDQTNDSFSNFSTDSSDFELDRSSNPPINGNGSQPPKTPFQPPKAPFQPPKATPQPCFEDITDESDYSTDRDSSPLRRSGRIRNQPERLTYLRRSQYNQ